MPRKYAPRKDEPRSLRTGKAAESFNINQSLMINALTLAIAEAGHGLYVKMNAAGDELRLKIYTEDDTYADVLRPSDDLVYLCDDYASVLGCSDRYRAVYGHLVRAGALTAPESAEKPAAQPKTLRGGS